MPWKFEQKTGRYFHNDQYVATGYAGRGPGENNPAMENVKGIGPLPVGWYTFQPPADDPVVGVYAMRLIPDTSNEMFGRNSFFEHGDSVEHPGLASHGCVVMPHPIREQTWESGDHRLQVVSGEPCPAQ